MDNHKKDSKTSPIYKFQLLVIGIESYLENLIQNNIIATQTKEGSSIS
jgi:hypothetical protein